MLEETYYFGITPNEAANLTFAEMASFVEAQKRRQIDEWKMLASVGYSTGLIGSMSLSKSRPRFDDIYNFPKDEPVIKDAVEHSKLEMLAIAANINAEYGRKVKDNE